MTNYYRKFIESYSKTAEPLYRLLKQGTVLVWREEQQTAFENLKSKLDKAPLITFFKFGCQLSLTTDASGFAIGATLKQCEIDGDKNVDRILGYFGRTLSDTGRR